MGDGDGVFEQKLLEEIQQKIQDKQCHPGKCREAELATLAQVGMPEVQGMSRSQVLVRLGDRVRFEGFACRIRKRGSDGPWRKGHCRRYGVKVFHFIPFRDLKRLDDVKRDAEKACGEPEFAPTFEEYLEYRIGEVLPIDEFDIVNDFEWALSRTGAQIHRTEQQLGRLRSDMQKLGNAYRRLLNSRTGGGRRGGQAYPAKGLKKEKDRREK